MRVFSRKSFLFQGYDGATVATASVAPLTFADVPDWVGKTLLFELACKAGDLEVIETKAQQRVVESEPRSKKPPAVKGGEPNAAGAADRTPSE